MTMLNRVCFFRVLHGDAVSSPPPLAVRRPLALLPRYPATPPSAPHAIFVSSYSLLLANVSTKFNDFLVP